MKRRTKIFIIILITAFILCCIDFRPWLYEKQREYLNRVDETRKEHGIGTCYDMEKSLCYYIVFINDDESRWNDDEKTSDEKSDTSITMNGTGFSASGITQSFEFSGPVSGVIYITEEKE